MSIMQKMEREFILADIAAVSSLLAQLNSDDVMTRFSLESRLGELEAQAEELAKAPPALTASAALFFGGRPVLGSRGIESDFGGSAVAKYQDLISKMLAHDAGTLKSRGSIPNKDESTLHITNIVRGSFGFLLEEINPQQSMVATPLKNAVNETTDILVSFVEEDEKKFQVAMEEIDERLLNTTRDFFNLLRQNDATLRLVSEESEYVFTSDGIERASERATSTRVDVAEEYISGELGGVLPDRHQFEFVVEGQDSNVIYGKVDRSIPKEQLFLYNRDFVKRECVAKFEVKKIYRNEILSKESHVLLGIEIKPNP